MAQDSDSASSTVPLMRAASQVWGAVHRGMDKDVWMVVTPYVRESFPHRDYGFEIVHAYPFLYSIGWALPRRWEYI